MQISLIISPDKARSCLFSAENSNLSTIVEATSDLIKNACFLFDDTILYIRSLSKGSQILPVSLSSSFGTYTKSFGDSTYLGFAPFSFSGAGDNPRFSLSMTTFRGMES